MQTIRLTRWIVCLSTAFVCASSYIVDENTQRMWDPEKGFINGRNIKLATMDNVTVTNQKSQVGMTAFLHCKVNNFSNMKVSWIRRRDNHILTSGRQSYSSDGRFSVLRDADSNDWALQVKFIQLRDQGKYECQVSTPTGSYTHLINLDVVIPTTTILGASELHVQSGSTISLQCVIEDAVVQPQYIFWYRNNKMINYDQDRGGISVSTADNPEPSSLLTISDAKFNDSGNYTCKADSTPPASVSVFVSEGDKPAAIQRLESGCSLLEIKLFPLILSIILNQICSFIFLLHNGYSGRLMVQR